MRKFWLIIGILAALIGGGLGSIWYFIRGLEQNVDVEGGVLVWTVEGEYSEERDNSLWGQVQSAGEPTITEVVFALQRAASDERITGLVMDFRGLKADWAKVAELRAAVAEFSSSGKPVISYIDAVGTRGYALACAADEVVISPEATIMVLGISAELSFMKGTLDKLGMKADFVHVGAYKSAPERMTRKSASAANREMITSIVDDRYQDLVDMIAASRGQKRRVAVSWIDHGFFTGKEAVNAGLADTLMYFDDVFSQRFNDEPTTDLIDYQHSPTKPVETSHQVALIRVTGVIMPGESRVDRFQGRIAGSATVVERLQTAADDDDIDAVVLRVDSPGGSALASDLMWNEIRLLQLKKPVIVSMSGYAASGGYYISCLADSIFAEPGTLTGSIGVFAGKMSRTKMYEKIGVHREFITRGENALLFSDEGGFTDTQRILFQNQMDAFYERFLLKVAAGRDMSRDEVHAIAQGRVWTGKQAVERGLVDGLGGIRRAIDSVKWTLGLSRDDKINLVSYTEPKSFLERILIKAMRGNSVVAGTVAIWQDAQTASGWLSLVPPELTSALRRDGTLATLAMLDGRLLAMVPFNIKFN